MPEQSESPSVRRRKRKDSDAPLNEENTTDSPLYTEDQVNAVEQIRKCKDYYEILGVDKDAGESDLRKQYKRLALQFHPDKNKTPGAVEAFKAIGNAFAVLNDPVKRKRYDEFGLEAMQTAESPHPGEGFYYAHSFEGDMTAEDIYNMFFHGPTYVRRTQYHRFNATRSDPYRDYDGRSTLMQLLPLVFVVTVSLLSSMFVADPPYSLQRTVKYAHERKTSSLDVPYYVQEGFPSGRTKDEMYRLERQVEDEYIISIRTSCFRERNYKENMIWRAKHFRDVTLEAKARDLRTPSCDTLNELYKMYQ